MKPGQARLVGMGIVWALSAASGCSGEVSADWVQSARENHHPKDGKPPPTHDAGARDAGMDRDAGSGVEPVRVQLAALEVAVPGKAGKAPRMVRVAVPSVEIELVEAPESRVARRVQTPVLDVILPSAPARRAPVAVIDLDLPDVCEPGVPTRARTPVVSVEVPDVGVGQVAPTRVRVPALEVTLPEGSSLTARRLSIPAIEQELPDTSGSAPRRVLTPVIEIGLLGPSDLLEPQRVLVDLPSQAEEASVRRVSIPVTQQHPGKGWDPRNGWKGH